MNINGSQGIQLFKLTTCLLLLLNSLACSPSDTSTSEEMTNITQVPTKGNPVEPPDPLEIINLPMTGHFEFIGQIDHQQTHIINLKNPSLHSVTFEQVKLDGLTESSMDEFDLDQDLSTCLTNPQLNGENSCSLVFQHLPREGEKALQLQVNYVNSSHEYSLLINIIIIGENPVILSVSNLPDEGFYELWGQVGTRAQAAINLENIGVIPAEQISLSQMISETDEAPMLSFMIHTEESSCLTDGLDPFNTCSIVISKELTSMPMMEEAFISYDNGFMNEVIPLRIHSMGVHPANLVLTNEPNQGYYEFIGIAGQVVSNTITILNQGQMSASNLRLSTVPQPDGTLRALPISVDESSSCLQSDEIPPGETCELILFRELELGTNIDSLFIDYFNGFQETSIGTGIHLISTSPAELAVANPPTSRGFTLEARVDHTATATIEIQNIGIMPATNLTPMGILDPDGNPMPLPVEIIAAGTTCSTQTSLEPEQICTYRITYTPRSAPSINIDTMRVEYMDGTGGMSYLSIGLRLVGLE